MSQTPSFATSLNNGQNRTENLFYGSQNDGSWHVSNQRWDVGTLHYSALILKATEALLLSCYLQEPYNHVQDSTTLPGSMVPLGLFDP